MNIHRKTVTVALLAALTTLGAATAFGISIDTVTVGNINNAPDSSGYGAVSYEYQIGKYEVTNTQYAAFLNAVSSGANPLSLYNSNMSSNAYGGITYAGGSYTVKAGYENKPVNYVSFYDAMRFTNWLTTGNTETGVYNLLGGTATPSNGTSVTRTLDQIPGTLWAIASEDEWYKAAYYKGGGTDAGYWLYPTQSDTLPTQSEANYYNGGYANANGPLGNGDRISDVGSYGLVTGAYGTFDQAGNMYEWNDTIISGNARVVRGGSFGPGTDVASSARYNSDPALEYYNGGFRVVALSSLAPVPEPATYAALAGLAMLGWAALRRRGSR
ncbi:PEP-CTERM putative exosortase interaction domain-containing protein [Opitutaceae bacterium TAV1]|nr:PEP-CTERM putative exosortase interaction domain-containing protein [Opitutaceae bacterium TAV1]